MCQIASNSPRLGGWHNEIAMPEDDPKCDFYCPNCAKPVREPLVCGDCRALICRECGTPLEKVDDLGIG